MKVVHIDSNRFQNELLEHSFENNNQIIDFLMENSFEINEPIKHSCYVSPYTVALYCDLEKVNNILKGFERENFCKEKFVNLFIADTSVDSCGDRLTYDALEKLSELIKYRRVYKNDFNHTSLGVIVGTYIDRHFCDCNNGECGKLFAFMCVFGNTDYHDLNVDWLNCTYSAGIKDTSYDTDTKVRTIYDFTEIYDLVICNEPYYYEE